VELAKSGLKIMRLQEYPNFRDLGGISAGPAGRLRHGMVYRSEAILDPAVQDAALLEARAIRLIFDLRSSGECGRAPNQFWHEQGAECINLDLMAALRASNNPWEVMRGDLTVRGAEAAMVTLYGGLPRAALTHAATLLGRIADDGLPVLVHCTAGKDRTGFMIAMLLEALGVEREAIIEDYLLSAHRKTAAAREATRAMVAVHLGAPIPEDALDQLMTVQPNYLAASFTAIDADFGGIDGYLGRLGVDRQALRARLLD
jgi:protein-tyrosine phosphatase